MLGSKHTPESIEKMRQSSLEKPRRYWLGKKRSKEDRKKMSEAKLKKPTKYWLGKKLGKKHNEKLQEGRKKVVGVNHPLYGKHHSKKTKTKIRLSLLGNLPWNKGVGGYKTRSRTVEERYEMSKRRLKDKNPAWKGGISPENKRIRNSIQTRLWRESVFSRDNWVCQKCRLKGGKLRAHHIMNFYLYPELRFAIDNGITFCDSCHRKFHKVYGFIKNTKEQIEEYLKKEEK